MSELKWYMVRAVSGQERKAKEYLENEVDRENFKIYSSSFDSI